MFIDLCVCVRVCVCERAGSLSLSVTGCSDVLEHQIHIRESILI